MPRWAITAAAGALFLLCLLFFVRCARFDGAFFIACATTGSLASFLLACRWYSARRGWYRDEHFDPYEPTPRWMVIAALAATVALGGLSLLFLALAGNMGCFGTMTL